MEENVEYNNNIYIIGKDTDLIKNKLNLDSFCKITTEEIKDKNQIDNIFDSLINEILKIKKNSSYGNKIIFSYTIIYSLNEINEEKNNIENLFKKLVGKLKNNFYYQPFIILLTKNQEDKQNIENFIKNSKFLKGFDKRYISYYISPINSDENNIEKIRIKIYRIFSYFYGLGDEFEIEDKEYKIYIPPKENLNSINILIIGKTQQGKSSFINKFLKEKRAREGKGKSETKEQLSYHLDEIPLIINDIEGFIGEDTINKVIEKIGIMQKKLQENELHLVIYIISYESQSFFNENEYLIFKQLIKKLDNTQFLFVCTKAKENDEDNKIEEIRESFIQMIKTGLEKEEGNNNIINVLNYLYFGVKKDISYDEIFKDKDDEESKKKYNNMTFFDRLELKFKGKNEVDKNCEMIETILEKDQSLLFVNLIEDNNHQKIFGMDKVSKQIRKALNYIKRCNLKFIYSEKKINEEKIEELEKKVQELKEKEKYYKNILYGPDPQISDIIKPKLEENTYLLENEMKKLINIEEINKNIENLINSLEENKVIEVKKYAENVKKKRIELAREDISNHNIYAIIVGIIPFVDLLIQHYIKKDAKQKIANRFDDDLIDFEGGYDKLSEKEKKYLKKVKEETSDIFGNISKTLIRTGTVITNIALKTVSTSLAGLGISIGMLTGGIQMSDDIEGFLEFYGKRLVYRLLINLSFCSIENYLIKNFEN